jgi:hypothetical protein
LNGFYKNIFHIHKQKSLTAKILINIFGSKAVFFSDAGAYCNTPQQKTLYFASLDHSRFAFIEMYLIAELAKQTPKLKQGKYFKKHVTT